MLGTGPPVVLLHWVPNTHVPAAVWLEQKRAHVRTPGDAASDFCLQLRPAPRDGSSESSGSGKEVLRYRLGTKASCRVGRHKL